MIAGLLNERVMLYEPTMSTDKYGSVKTAYTEYKEVAAEVRWKTGNTVNQEPEIIATNRIEVILRSAIPAVREWRLRYMDDIFHIDAVEHNRRKGYKRLFCTRVNE